MSNESLVLNAAQDTTNTVSGTDLKDIIFKTLSDINDHLLQISGPYARNNFILMSAFDTSKLSTKHQVGNTHIRAFTKDGRHTLAQMTYASPIQRYIKDEIITHIGKAVDNKCGDGTTSSMIFACSFIANLIKNRDIFDTISTTMLEDIYKEVTDNILHEIDNYKIDPADLFIELQAKGIKLNPQDTAEMIAYLQSMTSSSNNTMIAEAVSTVVKSTPPTLWKYAITQKYPWGESSTDGRMVKALVAEYEYMASCALLTHKYLAMQMDSIYRQDKIDVLVVQHGLISGDASLTKIIEYIRTTERPLCIIVPYSSLKNEHVIEEVHYVADHYEKHVVIFAYQRPLGLTDNNLWSMLALPIKADKPIYTSDNALDNNIEEFLIRDCKLHFDGKVLKLNNVVPVYEGIDIDNEVMHPGMMYPDRYQYFTAMKEIVEKELASKEAEVEKSETSINELKKAIAIITTKNNVCLEVSGYAMDQQAISLILDDASSASLNSLNNGIVFNGPYRLYQSVMKAYINESNNTDKNKDITHEYIFVCKMFLYKIILQACIDTVHSVYGPYAKSMNNIIPVLVECGNMDKYGYYTVNPVFIREKDMYNVDITSALNINSIFNFKADEEKYKVTDTYTVYNGNIFEDMVTKYKDKWSEIKQLPPCQPAGLYKVLLERIREACLRFAMSSKLIVPGTFWDNKLDKK